ncbi:hypothetical protein Pmar_PMAR023420 [Perkinsus marinus ATCC 50983]|uniref:Uncharacterized protein n=1 Tax=Perkinsus marinus (strain ATCC 50983 / TXsc) TaxID=423536 RepID=C5KKI2_PERM5|nr:hypothetical protein Pmar_PMAR023420 [Perkinsus marinus ATCC 50983]EER15094.1 hypothetical protein Pmar_PMAR023420 [Perkinsus marinus ATCC 50983]|eukprot:XP_002783298.1 hypothetical protein Pmar_PMAR023420 [Perkinsus marinus ATCC 50983]
MNHTRPLPPVVTTVAEKVQVQTPQERLETTKVDEGSYEIQVIRHRGRVPAERLSEPETSQQEIGWLIGIRAQQLKRKACQQDGSAPAVEFAPTANAAKDLPRSTVHHMKTLNPSKWRYSKGKCDVTEYVDK